MMLARILLISVAATVNVISMTVLKTNDCIKECENNQAQLSAVLHATCPLSTCLLSAIIFSAAEQMG